MSRSILVGKAVELAVGDRKVLGIYTEQMAATPKGAVLLLHDLGGHADWPGLIAHLRRDLPARGWDTLSLQLPIPAQRTTAEQQLAFLDGAGARIDAALAHLKAANQTDVVVVGHGFGAIAALEYALKNPQAFRGLVVAGLPHYRQGEPRLDAAGLLSQLKLPVLDLFGDGDRWEVVATAGERRQAARKNPGYSQLTLARADHFFSGQEPFMARRVRGWLERLPASLQTAPENDAPAPSPAPAAP